MALRAVAFHSTIRFNTIYQQLMDYDLLQFEGPVEVHCPSCGATFVGFFVADKDSPLPQPMLELQEKLLGKCNHGMHSFRRVELTTE